MEELVSVAEALSTLERCSPLLGSEKVPLADALGRRLAEDIGARVTQPPYSVSAMDGYAVRFEGGHAAGEQFTVVGEAPAGSAFDGAVGKGEAVRLFTGSRIPDGADHVIIQEHVERDGQTARLTKAQERAANIRAAGIDFASGDVLARAGTRVGPAEIACAAAADHDTLAVHRKPRVAFLANGDELRCPGSDPATGDIVASNAYGLAALVAGWGGEAIDLGIARDTIEAIDERIERARDADIIVPVGGASVGDHDHMFEAFAQRGLEPVFRKIAVRPGKPTWFGTLGDQLVLGLPGNPASAYVCAQLFLRSLMQGADALEWGRAVLDRPMRANGWRESFVRARLHVDEQGRSRATPLDRQDSSLITPFLEADCLVRRSVDALEAPKGTPVEILKLSR